MFTSWEAAAGRPDHQRYKAVGQSAAFAFHITKIKVVMDRVPYGGRDLGALFEDEPAG